MKFSPKVMTFASGNMDLFKGFLDYWNHSLSNDKKKHAEFDTTTSFSEKEDRINKELIKTIVKRSGVNYAGETNLDEWFWHPNVVHETFAVVGALIDMILPDSIIESIGAYSEIRTIGWGDSASFDIEPRDLFVVSKAGRSMREGEVHKNFRGQVTIVAERRELTVGVSLYNVLSGKESLANLAAKAVRSMETAMALDAYNAFYVATANLDSTATTGLLISAGYSQASLLRLCEQVGAWSQGNKPIIMGTSQALLNVLPDDANYRYTLSDPYTTIGYIPTISGYDIMRLPQVADLATPFGLALANDRLWILAPSAGKPVKVVIEGSTLSNTTGIWDKADLSQTTTLMKDWGVGIATSGVAGLITGL